MVQQEPCQMGEAADFRAFRRRPPAGSCPHPNKAVRSRTRLARKLFVAGQSEDRRGAVVREKAFGRCVIIDDDPDILLSARLLLRELFREVATFQDPEEALVTIEADPADVVLLDANFGRGATNAAEGFQWLGEILKRDPQAVVVMIT